LNLRLFVNKTGQKCVEKCPITHYLNQTSNECLPCDESCNSCNGTSDILGNGGCNKCISALVDNDSDYSIKRCIKLEKFNCTLIADSNDKIEYYYWATVPQNLSNHPLRGELVCRKCHSECKGCFTNGSHLNISCKECRNNYSESTNECVSVNGCSKANEYFLRGSKTCFKCHNECKNGCRGGDNYQCIDCQKFKLKFNDLKYIVEKTMEKYNVIKNVSVDDYEIVFSNRLIEKNAEKLNKENIYELVLGYRDYHITEHFSLYETSLKEDAIFCVSACPLLVPFESQNGFCSKEK
jgi:hypothetical protein